MGRYIILFLCILLAFTACDPLVWEDYEPIEDTTGMEEPGEEEPGPGGEVPVVRDSSLIFWAKDFIDGVAVDSSVYEVNGIVGSGIIVSEGSIRNDGSFLVFNDLGAVDLPSVELDTFSALTFSIWLRSYAGGSERLLVKGDVDSNEEKIEIGNDRLRLGVQDSNSENDCFVNESLLTGEWKMLTITVPSLNNGLFNSGNKIRIRGLESEDLSTCELDEILTSFADADMTELGPKLDGEIDNIRIYNRVLTEPEIDSIYMVEKEEFTIANFDFALPRNLISYYTFDEETLVDSKEGLNGVQTSPFSYSEDSPSLSGEGSSADFSALGSSWSVEDSYLDKINAFSASFWLRTDADGYEPLITQGVSPNNNHGIILNTGVISCGTDNYFFGGADFAELVLDNEWHLITLVCEKINQTSDSGDMELYVDSQKQGETLPQSNLDFLNISALYIGTENNGGFFTGQMDNIRFYNKELTQTEIDTIYQSERE